MSRLKNSIPWNKGKKMSEKIRANNSLAMKKRWTDIRNNGGKTICLSGIHPLKGKKGTRLGMMTPLESRIKQSLAKTGKTFFDGFFNERQTISFKIRQIIEYKSWRLSIIERDNSQCVFCGCDENLQVDHHPMSLGEIVKRFHIETIEQARNCEILWDIKNGRVLCKPCHEEIHPRTLKYITNSNLTKV